VGAALFMTLFRSLIRAVANLEYFEHTEDPLPSTSERLKRAMLLTNNYIAETHGDSGMFATLFFGILDPHDGRLTYINGGHEPPIILQSGIVHDVLRKTGPAVGTIKDGNFGLAETRLQAGDMFVAYTDGVLDCTNSRGEFYGRERLLDVLQNTGGSALELVNAIEADLRQFIAGASQFDDMTLLVARQDSNSVNMKGS
jgi:serine phosphatase RsbU (regulator of sigma subunit)